MRLDLFGPVGWESADFTHCLNKELISITQACMHLQNHDFFNLKAKKHLGHFKKRLVLIFLNELSKYIL